MQTLTERIREYDRLYEAGYLSHKQSSFLLVLRVARRFKERGVKSILDVGCGRGFLLKELDLYGFDMTGTEIVPCLMQGPLKKLPVVQVPVIRMSPVLDGQVYDLVLFVDVLDHLPNKDQVARALCFAEVSSTKGIIVTLGGRSSMKMLDYGIDWWEETIKREFRGEILDRIVDTATGAYLLGSWRNVEETGADSSCDE